MLNLKKLYFSCALLLTLGLTGCQSLNISDPVDVMAAELPYDNTLVSYKPEAAASEETQAENTTEETAQNEAAMEENKNLEKEVADKNFLPSPNEAGDLMIIMYHKIVDYPTSSNLERNADDFKNDLQRLYDEGYRLISIKDLINNDINIENGYTPVVLTFDDGWSTAFSLTDKAGELVPRENCGVDIINKFTEEHPDFGKAAVFYINGYLEPFKGAGTLEERFRYLLDNGYELGNHTYSHSNLSKLSGTEIQNEIVSLDLYVKYVIPDAEMLSFCYPYGIRPKEDMRELALNGEYTEKAYSYQWALRAGPSNASAVPNHIKFDPLNIPRVRGTNNEKMDLWWFLDYYKENPHLKYVSDGDPKTISVPKGNENLVNKDNLGDKNLNLY